MTGEDGIVDAAIDRAAAALPADDAAEFARLMRAGLDDIDTVVGPADLVVEIQAATDVPPAEKLAAARRFASRRRAFRLSRESWELLRGFISGELSDQAARNGAEELLGTIMAAIDAEPDEAIRRELGDNALECRYVLSSGTGPISLRGAKLVR